jgi:thiamine-monophosphate kinase
MSVASEDTLIARHFAPLAAPGGFGLKDDAALLAPKPGHELVITKDMLVSGVHFFAEDPPASIARKALRVNLSDLAAKGAEPAGFLLGLALPAGTREAWVAAFAAALGEDAAAYRCPLLGGDTVKASGGLTISITAFGAVPTGRMLRRTAGRPGHLLAVTGTIGDAALGLRLRLHPDAQWAKALSPQARAHLFDRYLHPQPRNAVAEALRAHAAAAMDVSDGLLGDALKLSQAAMESGEIASPVIDLGRLPLSQAAREALALEPSLISAIATGGDDYEVLAAVAPENAEALASACAEAGVALTMIGELQPADRPPRWIGLDGKPFAPGSLKFEHAFKA